MIFQNEMRAALEKEPKLIGDVARKETMQDLFDLAAWNWSLSEDEVRGAIKAAGYSKWDGMQWDTYVSVLRDFWLKKHIAELAEQGITAAKTHEEKRKELLARESGIQIVVTADGWHFEGTPDQMAAHWELEDLLRKERIRQARRRLAYERDV